MYFNVFKLANILNEYNIYEIWYPFLCHVMKSIIGQQSTSHFCEMKYVPYRKYKCHNICLQVFLFWFWFSQVCTIFHLVCCLFLNVCSNVNYFAIQNTSVGSIWHHLITKIEREREKKMIIILYQKYAFNVQCQYQYI